MVVIDFDIVFQYSISASWSYYFVVYIMIVNLLNIKVLFWKGQILSLNACSSSQFSCTHVNFFFVGSFSNR